MQTQSIATGPFVVTVKHIENGPDPYHAHQGSKFECPECGEVGYLSVRHSCTVSRRAVATLEEARLAARRVVELEVSVGRPGFTERHSLLCNTDALQATGGGTVGPLPDGTVIEVEPITEHAMGLAIGREDPWWDRKRLDEKIAAYNEAQGGVAS